MSDQSQTSEEVAQVILNAANSHSDKEESRILPDALSAVAEVEPEKREEVRAMVSEGLPGVTAPAGAGLIGIWLGASVEGGRDPKISGPPVLATLLKWSQEVPEVPEDAGEEEIEEADSDLVGGLEMLGQAAVAHLARDENLLTSLQEDREAHKVLSIAEDWSAGPMWVMEILRQQSGELIVLHGHEKVGFKVGYENLSNCFHFFTLLQGALETRIPGGQSANGNAMAAARGEESGDVSDGAWWHYGQPTSPEPDLGSTVFGEGGLDSIASVEGTQVIVLWPMIMESRTWGGGFFGPYLAARPPKVEILEQLKENEILEWRTLLGLRDRPTKKPWWKVFG